MVYQDNQRPHQLVEIHWMDSLKQVPNISQVGDLDTVAVGPLMRNSWMLPVELLWDPKILKENQK
jgi:hypothetical protein